MGKERRSFSAEFKRDAVARIAASGEGLTQTARSLGIHLSLLLSWRRKLAVMNEASVTRSESLEDENRRLRRENAGLREDREILKKAAADSTHRCNTLQA